MLFVLWAMLIAPLASFASPTNVTIDDQSGDAITGLLPTYSPSDAWNQGAQCSFCSAKPNASDAFNGTWHDGTYVPGAHPEQFGITLQFNGTAVWMFNILAQEVLTVLNFTLDDEDAGSFTWDNSSSFQFVYNQAVFSRRDLQSGSHTLVATSSGSSVSLILFDYAIYTTESDVTGTSGSNGATSSPSAHSTPVGAIVGGVVGGLVGITLLVSAIFYYRRHSSRLVSDPTVHPFMSETLPPELMPEAKAKHSALDPPTSSIPVLHHSDTSQSTPESTPPSPPPHAPVQSSNILPSVLDIHGGTRTMATTPAGPLAQSTSSQSERERQLEAEIEALRAEMRRTRDRKVVPFDSLPGYNSARQDVLIHGEP